MRSYHHWNLYLSLVLAVSCLVSLIGLTSLYAISLQQKDYTIKDFGIKDGTPFMLVEGTAGGSYDPSMGEEGYEAYVFDTDKGVFQVSEIIGYWFPWFKAIRLFLPGTTQCIQGIVEPC